MRASESSGWQSVLLVTVTFDAFCSQSTSMISV